jgi:hypothetical protein
MTRTKLRISTTFGTAAAGTIVAALLLSAACSPLDEDLPPGEEGAATETAAEAESNEQAVSSDVHLPDCSGVCKGPETCNSACAFKDGDGWVATTCGARNQCLGDGFEKPGDRPSGTPTPSTGEPRNYCANTNFRSCKVSGPFRLIAQYVKRECAFLGIGCKNAVYEVVAAEQDATDCEACPCKFITRKRCNNGRLVNGNWGGARPACGLEGPDRAICN